MIKNGRRILALLGLAIPCPLLAQTAQSDNKSLVTLEANGGYLSGLAREYVLDPETGNKSSQLDWSSDDTLIVGARVTVQPTRRLQLYASGWVPVASAGDMKDRDWQNGYSGFESWTDYSRHQSVKMKGSYQFDVGAAVTLAHNAATSLDLVGGYQRLNLSWTSRGGLFIYSVDGGFRNLIGEFEGDVEGHYRQRWETPYLGLRAGTELSSVRLGLGAIGSPFVKVSDRDIHPGNRLFEGRYKRASMFGVNASAEYDLAPALTLTAGANFQRYYRKRGDLTLTEAAGEPVFGKGAAALDNHLLIFTLGLKTRF